MDAHELVLHKVKEKLAPLQLLRNPDWEKQIYKYSKRFQKKLKRIVEVVELRIRKWNKQANGNFNEIQQEMKHDLYAQYINSNVSAARDKAVNEFECIEKIRRFTSGASLGLVFKEWKKFHFTQKQRARRDLRAKWRDAIKGFNTAMESVRSAQALADFWVKCADVYTDQPFWKHKLTGEIVIDRPSIQNYLPPNFTVPDPPEDLPPGISLDTSSSESEGEWENNRIQMREAKSKDKNNDDDNGDDDDDDDDDSEEGGESKESLAIENSTVDESVGANEAVQRHAPIAVNAHPSTKDLVGVTDDDTSKSSISGSKSTYGPDTLRSKSSKGRSARVFADPDPVEVITELERKVILAKAYMQTEKYKSVHSVELPDIHQSDMHEVRHSVKQRGMKEVDRAERAIRKMRSNISVTRHNTYISQVYRKQQSYEEILAERRKRIVEEEPPYEPPSPEKLLELAGGTAEMAQLGGDAGNHLRTVLAFRALHIKNKLHERAVRRGEAKPKKVDFVDAHIAPIWKENYEESDDEDEETREQRLKMERKKARAKEREAKANIDAKFNGLAK